MKKLTSYKTNEIMKLFLILFLTLNIVMITIGGTSYVYTLNIFKESIYQQNISNIENISNLFESKVMAAEDLAEDICASINMSDIAYKEELTEAETQYTVKKIIEYIQYSSARNTVADDVYIYLEKSDIIISQYGYYNSATYFDKYLSSDWQTYQIWKQQLLAQEFPTYTTKKMANNDEDIDIIQYIRPFNIHLGDVYGCIVVDYDNNEIINILQKGILLSQTSTQIIYTPLNETMVSVGDKEMNSFIKSKNISSGETTLSKTDYGNLIIMRSISLDGKFEYIYTIPTNIFYSGLGTMVIAMSIIILLQILLGAILTILFSRKSYKPIEYMEASIREMVDDYTSESGNPIEDIKNITSMAVSGHDAMKKELERAKPMMVKSFLTQVLHGNISEIKFLSEDMAGDLFEKDGFICIKIHIDDCKEFIVDETIEEMQLAKIAILNMVEEVFSEKFKTTVLDYDFTNVVVILNIDYTIKQEKIDEYFEEIKEIFKNFQNVLYEYFKIYTSAGVSLMNKGIADLHLCVKQSQQAINQKIVSGLYEISFYEKYFDVVDTYSYKLQDEVYLINSTKTGDYEKVKELLDIIIKDNEQVFRSPIVGQCFMVDIVSTMLRIITELNVPNDIVDIEISTVLTGSYSKILEKIYGNYKIICNWVNKNKKSHNTQMREQIETYIKSHYLDNSLSLVSVADYMNLNPTYLSVFIKEQFGDTFVSYVLNLRMEEAKRLLTETTLSMQDIAIKIGYANSGVFIRVFKKKFGYTPGSYRSCDK